MSPAASAVAQVLATPQVFPERGVARRARICWEDAVLRCDDGHGGSGQWAVGAGGIVDGVLYDAARIVDGPVAEPSGVLVLRNAHAEPVVQIPLDSWLPERADLVEHGLPDARAALQRSGLAGVLAEAGVPVRVVSDRTDESFATLARLSQVPAAAPRWDSVLAAVLWRMVFLLVGVAALIGVFVTGSDSTAWLSFLALAWLAAALYDSGVLLRAYRRDGSPAGAEVFAPVPAVPVNRAFLSTARVRLDVDVVVIVAQDGSERQLPRTGPVAVAEWVRVREPEDRVELRTVDGYSRAVFSTAVWFGDGADADRRMTELAEATGLPYESEGSGQPGPVRHVGAFDPQPVRPPLAVSGAGIIADAHYPVTGFSLLALVILCVAPGPAWAVTAAALAVLLSGGRPFTVAMVRRVRGAALVPPGAGRSG